MLRHIFAFEARYHLKSAVFWLSAAVFFLLAFGAVTTDSVQIGGAIGNVNRNAPVVIMMFTLVMSIIASFVVVAFVAGAVLRDHEHGTAGLLFSTPMRKREYVTGRFLGAFTVSAGIMVAVLLAVLVGSAMPWLEPERVGPLQPGAYLYAFFVLALPNLFLMSAIFFGLATLTRSMLGSYIGLVGFFVAYAVAMVLVSDLESARAATLADPFAVAAFSIATQYWTPFERNTRVLGLDPDLLWNRALWTGIAVLVLAVTYARFSLTAETTPLRRRGGLRRPWRRERPGRGPESGVAGDPDASAAAPRREPMAVGTLPAPRVGPWPALAQLLRQAVFEVRGAIRSIPFVILLVLGVLNVVGAATAVEQFAGTPVHPRTHLMIQAIQSAFLLFTVIILTFYAGELVFRDRQRNVDGIHDALPVPDWVLWGGKLVALAAIVLIVLAVGVLTTIGVQLAQGFADIEPGLYALGVGVLTGWPFLLIAVLALAAQVVTNNKYAGFLVIVLYFISDPVLSAMGWTHNLYRYAQSPPAPYSDMNGYGHFLAPSLWFNAYWTMAAVVLLALTHLFWVRGGDTGVRVRLRRAGRRLNGRVAVVLGVGLLAFLGLGGWIYYNTNVLNEFVSPRERQDRMAEYERRYKRYQNIPQPRIRTVYSEVDIHPEERALDIRGIYTLVNRTTAPIDSLHLTIPTDLAVRELRVPGGTEVVLDTVLGYRIYALAEPLAAGASMTLGFELALRTRGFVNGGSDTNVVGNGTFINNFEYFPHVGYAAAVELQDPNERRKRGLPPVERMAPMTDSVNLHRTYISGEGDWVEFETVVSTSANQVALAPGYLEREWTENGRRYFHYAMDAPILPFWSYLSADWAVETDRWNDVEIAVYHHPDHRYNVARMIDAAKKSLDYFTREFGPYQHRQLRIVEFPRYARFAQSFPNTIPFSESIGFIARLTDEDAIDYVFYVTAHEVAHQWWAHQVIGANVQGATVLSETMAQYSALMVMEEEYGPSLMRRFLKYELDQYLQGRGSERIEELPLYLVENQPYVHYRKGSLAMYALRDHVGEAPLNREIQRYVSDVRFQDPPYTTSAELLDYLGAAVPDGREGILDDLFRTITLWDLRATEAVGEALEDGRWRVRLDVDARKYRASGLGEETEVAMEDWVDVAVFGEETEAGPPEGEVLLLEKRQVASGPTTIELVVDAPPRRAGVDPFNKLIDRNPEDNLVGVDR